MRSPARFDLNWILVVLLAVFAIAPLAYPGFFEAHSGFLPVFSAGHLSNTPHGGRIAAIVRDEGKLPYLLVQPILHLSGSGVVAIKWGYALAFLLGALGVYAWTRRWLGAKGGVLAAVIYTYLPWHLGTVYVRGAYAEAWLWAFWPFLLWALDHLADRQPLGILVAVAAGLPLFAATLWTQPGLALLSVPLLLAYAVTVPRRRPWPVLPLVEALALSMLLLWAIARRAPEARFIFDEHFLYPLQLVSAAWEQGLSFQLGLAAVGLGIVAVALQVGKKTFVGAHGHKVSQTATENPHDFWFWASALIVLILLTLPLSGFFWQASGFSALLTYPWQLLALAGLPLAFLGGAVIRLDERLATLPARAGLVALVVLASYPYLAPCFTAVDPGPEPVAMLQPVEADMPQIILLDYEVVPPTEITPTLTLTLTWQAVEPVRGDYTVFVHVLAEGDAKAAQRDTRPCDGECPTNTWQPGEIVVDRYRLDLVPGAPPGPYHLAVGLYLLETGDRAAVAGRDDRTVYLNVP